MKYSILLSFLILLLGSCSFEEKASSREVLSYDLYQSSDFAYEGKAEVIQLPGGDIEVLLKLNGPHSEEPYFFTSHLHFGSYDELGADIAHVLNPVDIRTLESRTKLGKLSNGSTLNFDDFPQFDGHIKVHLADEGPDYNVILVSGNIGKNDNSLDAFNLLKLENCSPYFPVE